VTGADLGSRALSFEPSQVRGGNYQLAVGTAGSATLVFQTVLPAPSNIAKRELGIVRERLALDRSLCRVESIETSAGPGNV
jgi:RNA 3'-terminal phosphate cyclase